MDNGMFDPFQCFEGLLDDVFPRLCQDLYGHIVGNHVPFYQRAEKFELCFRCRRKPYFDFFKSHADQHFVEFQFFFEAHGNDQRLIAIAQIDTAPDWRLIGVLFACPAHIHLGRHKITFFVLFNVFHPNHS